MPRYRDAEKSDGSRFGGACGAVGEAIRSFDNGIAEPNQWSRVELGGAADRPWLASFEICADLCSQSICSFDLLLCRWGRTI